MADSSEIKSKEDAELQRSKRDQQDSSFLETLVPIPDFFFNIKAEIEPIGGSKWRIRIFGYIWYFISVWGIYTNMANFRHVLYICSDNIFKFNIKIDFAHI